MQASASAEADASAEASASAEADRLRPTYDSGATSFSAPIAAVGALYNSIGGNSGGGDGGCSFANNVYKYRLCVL